MKLQGHETVIIVQVFGHLECVGVVGLIREVRVTLQTHSSQYAMTKLNMSN